MVDDAIEITQLLGQLLQSEGYQVRTASTGTAALEALAQEPFDLVLLDLRLPDISGLDICRRLHQQPGYEKVPVLFLTASRTEQDIVAAFDSGAADYIRKPFNLAELLARVSHHLELRLTRISLEAAIAELTILAETDPLTGLANRRHALEQVEREFLRFQRTRSRFSILTLDLDHFKRVNDRFGHAAGDALLKRVAQQLQLQLRQIDELGRMGGEEFLVLLPETDGERALEVAERLREAIATSPLDWHGQELSVTISIGVSAVHDRDGSIDTVLQRSDHALYAAKNSGRNRCCLNQDDTLNLVVTPGPSRILP